MEPQKNKNSIFSGLFPSNEPPAPQPLHVTQPARPEVSEEQVSALNKKIESMERSIVGQLEKRFSEQPPPPPPPPSAVTPAVLSKITEMENRFKEFQDKFLLGASQIKNIEESKISARREIEELLKVVREQQKYSELDRQMHDQLEKAWGRVEEMEKRLVEAYRAAADKPVALPAPPVPQVSAGEIAAAVLKAVDGKLEERLRPLESALKNAAAKAAAVPEYAKGVEMRVNELSVSVDARLNIFSAEIKQLGINAFAGKERLEDIVTDIKVELGKTAEAGTERIAGVIRQSDSAALETRERLDAVSKMLVSHIDGISESQALSERKISELSRRYEAGWEPLRESSLAAVRDMEKTMLEKIDSMSKSLRADNAAQFENAREAFALSESARSALSSSATVISGLEIEMKGLSAALAGLLKNLSSVNLEGILGVSGAVLRKSLEEISDLSATMSEKTAQLCEKRSLMADDLKKIEREGRES